MTVKTASIHPDAPIHQNIDSKLMQNAITLTFNGTDFKLIPSNNEVNSNSSKGDSSISMVANGGKFTMLNLQSFTGCLIVSESLSINGNTNDLPSAGARTNTNMNTNTRTPVVDTRTVTGAASPIPASATVEDEPPTPSPNHAKAKKIDALPQGQQQLSFVNKKKRVSLIV